MTRNSTSKPELHDQNLEDVIIALERCEDRRAKEVMTMAYKGSIYPLNEENIKPVRDTHKKPGVFPAGIWDTPVLCGHSNSPLETPLDTYEVQNILTADIDSGSHFRFVPSLGSAEMDAGATARLLDNISNPVYNKRGAIINMQSPTIEGLHTNRPKWQSDGILGQSSMQMTVAPAHEVFDLTYYEHYFISTLLTGSKIWLAYPPRHGNTDALIKAYEKLQGVTTGSAFLDIMSELKNGIVILQNVGETLVMPPFWTFIVFCPETSVSGAYLIATALKFMERLLHIPLYMAVLRIWDDKAREQAELVKYVDSIATHMSMILGNQVTYLNGNGVIRDTCASWAKIKTQVAQLCAAIDDEEQAERIIRTFCEAWVDFLEDRRKKKPECRLCHVRIEHMPVPEDDSPRERLKLHFMKHHSEFGQSIKDGNEMEVQG